MQHPCSNPKANHMPAPLTTTAITPCLQDHQKVQPMVLLDCLFKWGCRETPLPLSPKTRLTTTQAATQSMPAMQPLLQQHYTVKSDPVSFSSASKQSKVFGISACIKTKVHVQLFDRSSLTLSVGPGTTIDCGVDSISRLTLSSYLPGGSTRRKAQRLFDGGGPSNPPPVVPHPVVDAPVPPPTSLSTTKQPLLGKGKERAVGLVVGLVLEAITQPPPLPKHTRAQEKEDSNKKSKFEHPAKNALIQIKEVIHHQQQVNIGSDSLDIDGGVLVPTTKFEVVPCLYKCPQGFHDGIDQCSCFTGDWSWAINDACLDMLQANRDISHCTLQQAIGHPQANYPRIVFMLSLNCYLYCPKLLVDYGVCAQPLLGSSSKACMEATHQAMYAITLKLISKAGNYPNQQEPGSNTPEILKQLVAGSDASQCVTNKGIMKILGNLPTFESGAFPTYNKRGGGGTANWILDPPKAPMRDRDLKLLDFLVLTQIKATVGCLTGVDLSDEECSTVYANLKNQEADPAVDTEEDAEMVDASLETLPADPVAMEVDPPVVEDDPNGNPCQLVVDNQPVSAASFSQACTLFSELSLLAKLLGIGLSLVNKKLISRSYKIQREGVHVVFQRAMDKLTELDKSLGTWHPGTVMYRIYTKDPGGWDSDTRLVSEKKPVKNLLVVTLQ
ncbi:hypothetical protein BDR26DRAFT_975503 [Obelidium mucronatum]|nr:hypothetical protein BDR26DRAFT_975503 [Obelidium mucronatum]